MSIENDSSEQKAKRETTKRIIYNQTHPKPVPKQRVKRKVKSAKN